MSWWMPDWITRRLWWRVVLCGVVAGQLAGIVTGQWNIRYLVALAALAPAVIALHPIMDQPVKFFGPIPDTRRFYVGLACALAGFAVGFSVTG